MEAAFFYQRMNAGYVQDYSAFMPKLPTTQNPIHCLEKVQYQQQYLQPDQREAQVEEEEAPKKRQRNRKKKEGEEVVD